MSGKSTTKGEPEADKDMIKPGKISQRNSAKVLANALTTLIQAQANMQSRLHTVQTTTSEITILRQEIVEMNRKLDRLIEFLDKTPEANQSTLVKYLFS